MKTEPMPEPTPPPATPKPISTQGKATLRQALGAAVRRLFQRRPAAADAAGASDSTRDPSATPAPAPSNAPSALDYRLDGARHLYQHNAERIYKGRLPPQLFAIGVLNVHINRRGRVTELDWLRAPTHAPEVIAEIERTVVEASPFPVPSQLGQVVYTDTWLWHESGHFQLDTLTEGQD